jgi:hypothetical protein
MNFIGLDCLEQFKIQKRVLHLFPSYAMIFSPIHSQDRSGTYTPSGCYGIFCLVAEAHRGRMFVSIK